MNEKELFEQAAAKAEKINKTCKDYELARASLEALQQDNAVLHIIVESIDKAEEKRFTLTSLTRSSELAIIDHLKSLYSQRIDKCKEIVSGYVQAAEEPEKPRTIMTVADSYANAIKQRAAESTPKEVLEIINKKPIFSDRFVESAKKITEPKKAAPEHHFHGPIPTTPKAAEPEAPTAAEEAPSTTAVKVSNERIEQLRSEGLSATQIAKVTGMKPNTVTHRIRYNEDKIDRKAKTEKPDPTPRVLSKDIISDTELEEQYFKHGKTVKEIAQKYGIKPDGLYKRIEAMKAERQNIAKECVSSQR